MLKNRITLAVIAGSAVFVPIAGVSALTASPAGALGTSGIHCNFAVVRSSKPPYSYKIELTGCSAVTGDSGLSKLLEGQTTETVNWRNGDKTTFSTVQSTGTLCATGTTAEDEVITGSVISDDTGKARVGGAVSAEICISDNQTISLAPATKFVIA